MQNQDFKRERQGRQTESDSDWDWYYYEYRYLPYGYRSNAYSKVCWNVETGPFYA